MVLQSGMTFRGAKLAYQTYGKLNEDKSNVILYINWLQVFGVGESVFQYGGR